MPITIREILASDTISGAADKINFNFDKLLLNGGGPPGPPGPQGPIGPIGGRGIRGSVWYEGLGDPNLVPPTLTPEDEDNYLQGNGDVWTYNGNTWVNTGISLIGPVGPAGASGKFSEYQGQPGTYSTAGDTTLYPNLMTPPPSVTSGNTSNRFIKAVVIGGLPGNLPGVINPNPSPGPEVIASSLAVQIVQPDISLFVHQFNSSGGGIKFHGGDAIVDNFTNILGELAEIRLLRDDKLSINVPKPATAPSSVTDVDGLSVTTPLRGQLYQSGKRIQFQTGVSTFAYSSGDTNDFIVDAARYGSGSNPTIQLNVLGTTSAPTAAFRLGSVSTTALPIQNGDARLGAGVITIDGSISITETSPEITLNGSTSTRIFAGSVSIPSVNGHLTLGAASQVNMFTANGSATGSIVIATGNSTPGNVVIATGTTSTGDILVSTSAGLGRVNLTSGAGNSGGLGAINLVTDSSSTGNIGISTSAGTGDINLTSGDDVIVVANNAIAILTDTGSAGNITLTTAAGTGQLNLSSASSVAPGAINISTSGSTASNINLITAASSPGSIFMLTGSSSTGNIGISTAFGTGAVNITSGHQGIPPTNAINIATTSGSNGNITISSSASNTNVSILSGTDIFLQPGSSSNDAVLIQPPLGSSNSGILDIRPWNGPDAQINVWGGNGFTAARLQIKTTNTLLVGEIQVVAGMTLKLNASNGGTDIVHVQAGNNPPTAGSDDPRFKVDANNHYTHTAQITHNANINIFSSGLYTSSVPGNWTSYSISWMRVGNVVTGSGIAVDWLAVGTIIPVPVVGSGNIQNVNGVWTRDRGNDATLKQVTGHIEKHSATNSFEFYPIGSGANSSASGTVDGGISNAYVSGPISIRFSFSYVIA